MESINKKRFETLLTYAREHENGHYILFDNSGNSADAVYETDYESDNGLEDDDYEEYQCITFKRVKDGSLFEVNYRNIPVKVVCDEDMVY